MADGGFFLSRLWGSHYLRESAFFIVLQNTFQVLIGLFQVWVLTYYLSREAYGAWGYVSALVAMASIFTLPGVNQAITYGAAHSQHGVLMAGMRWRFYYGLLASVTLLVLSWTHTQSGHTQAAELLLIAALFMPTCQALESMDSFLTGLGNFKALFWRRMLLQGTLAVFIWVGAASTGSLWVCGVILYGGGALISGILFLFLLKYRQNHLLPDQFRGIAKQFSLQSIGTVVSLSMERPLLSQFVDFQQIAAYNMALTAQFAVSYGRLIDRILISRLARSRGGITRSWVWFGVWLLFGVGWPAWLVLVAVIRLLVPILFPAYVDAVPLMEILLLQIPFAWGSKPGLNWLMAHAETHIWYNRLIWGIIVARIFLITIGVWMGGMTGVAWAWVGVEGGTFVAVVIVLSRTERGISKNET